MTPSLHRFAPAAVAVALGLASPAAAQFRWPWESPPFSEPKPAEAPQRPVSAAPARPAAGPAAVTRVLPPRRPTDLTPAPEDERSAVTAAIPSAAPPDSAPAARSAPAQVATAQAATAQVAPAVTPVAAPSARAPAEAGPLTDAEIVRRANLYLNGIATLVGDFVQVGADGRRVGGTLYLHRPGRLRFEYDQPSNLEVVADGTSVAIRDRKLATQDLYAIAQTPLKFLLRANVELGRDIRVVDAAQENDGVRLALEDRSTLGGTSKITLFFDPAVETLKRWRVVDPQGFQTSVTLSNLDRARRVDPRLFVINYETFRN